MKKKYRHIFWLLLLLLVLVGSGNSEAQVNRQGQYFFKSRYEPVPLPTYQTLRKFLPSPIYDEDTSLIQTYWKTWELAFSNFHEPTEQNGFVSQYIDAAFNSSTFQWDDCFMSMFCNYAFPLVPGVSSLDNFYAKQHADGEICRELVTETGKDYWISKPGKTLYSKGGYGDGGPVDVTYQNRKTPIPPPLLTLDGMNHPIFAWAEWESYLLTGNKERLSNIWEPLAKYYQSLKKYIRQGNGLYMTDWASMDNSPRNIILKGGGTGIDISSEMVLFARNMADIAKVLGKNREKLYFEKEADTLSAIVNKLMWDKKINFYVDLNLSGNQVGTKTVAAFWTLLSGIASPKQAAYLVDQLNNPNTFGRVNPVPTLSADEYGYASYGNYWCGSVWAPTNTMVICGLEKYGYHNLAYEIAMKHLRLVAKVYDKTGTIWENYSPDSATYGLHANGNPVEKNFVGWSGIGPIMYLIKYAIGLNANSIRNEIIWTIHSSYKVGCKNFRFNNNVITLIAEPVKRQNRKSTKIQVIAERDFKLRVRKGENTMRINIHSGNNEFFL